MTGPDRVVILAGGGGTRLWPWTGPGRPKPLLPLGGGGRTLVRATLERLSGAVPPEAVTVLAPADIGEVIAAAEPELRGRIWSEPSPRDTGPAVAFAMRRVRDERPDAVVALLPADHRIADVPAFRAALAGAAEAARAGEVTLLGVRPDRPSTRFGYIQPEPGPGGSLPGGALRVQRFVEKPAADAAKALVTGGALWNAGVFVWRADVFWRLLERHAPELAAAVGGGNWDSAPRTSIDYALLERLPRVAAVPLAAGWDDVGGWEAVAELAAVGDAGPVVALPVTGDAPGSLVLRVGDGDATLRVGDAPGRAVVLGGAPVLVVCGPEGVLVSPRADADRVRTYVT